MDVSGWTIGGIAFVAFVLGRVTGTQRVPLVVRPPASPRDVEAADAEIATLVRAGEKLEAIKRYRALHGVDLKAAKEAVEAIASRGGT